MKLPVYTYRYRCDEDFSNFKVDVTIVYNLVHQLQAEVEYVRTERRWKETYMTLDEIVQDAVNAASATAKAEGIAEGIEKGIENTLIELVDKGVLTIEQAAEQAGIPAEEFRKLLKKN